MAESTPHVSRRLRRGMTLIEILIAAAIAMIVLLAVISIFQQAGGLVAEGRASIELAGQVRRAGEQIRSNLRGVTVPTRAWSNETAAEGYLEIFEGYAAVAGNSWSGGPSWDGQLLTNANKADDIYGDLDDVLMFTARSDGEPFVGQLDGTPIESNLAEIIIWPVYNPGTGDATIYRRILLIRPDLNNSSGFFAGHTISSPAQLQGFYADHDLSVHIADFSTGAIAANTLADLNKRENRTLHVQFGANNFPYPFNYTLLPQFIMTGPHTGEDVLLRHATAFDVQVYEPNALVRVDTNVGQAMSPSDPGYTSGQGTMQTIGQGCYVDLGYGLSRGGASPSIPFSMGNDPRSKLNSAAWLGYTYCTWSSFYERDGQDQDNDMYTDEGTNGLDDNNTNGPDDAGEQETSPPYPVPLRGIQVKIRAMDIANQKARQVTVQQDFLRE